MPPSHTSTHHNRESWRLPLVGRNFAFWTQCQTQHPRKVALVPAKPRISKDSFGNSKYICMGILSQLPTRCVNTSFLWPGEVWIKHRQCDPPGHVQVKQPTIQPYCIRVFANTRQFASCHPGTLFCANCRIRPSEFACQITFFFANHYTRSLWANCCTG